MTLCGSLPLVLSESSLAWKDMAGKANACAASMSRVIDARVELNSNLVKSVWELEPPGSEVADPGRWVFPQGQTSLRSLLGLFGN